MAEGTAGVERCCTECGNGDLYPRRCSQCGQQPDLFGAAS